MTESQQTLSPLIHLVARDALLERLDAGRDRRLTLVQAPVGFGKTTLLTQWQARLRSLGTTVAWVVLHEDSWTPELLLRAIAAALEAAGVEVKLEDGLLGRRATEAWRRDVDTLLETIRRIATPLVIVLDEYEHCDSPDVNPVVAQLLARLPAGAHVVIASRQRPALPVARLYAEGQVTLLGADDLRLSASETADLLQNHLSPDSVERVHRLTEGWVVLVQLARLWLGAGGRPEAVLEALTDPREEIGRFLAEQVLTVLPDEERAFLVETSFLDRFTPALSDYVRQREGSERFLDAMGRLYPLVSADGSSSSTVRVHPLLRAEARHLLSLRSRSAVSALQRRAAHWLARNGDVYAGMCQAAAADDPDLAAELFERAGSIRLIDAEGPPILERMLRLLPAATREARPRVRLAEIAFWTIAGRREEARAAYDELARRTDGFKLGVDDATRRDLRTDALVGQLFMLVFCDETISSAQLREFEQLDLDDPAEDLRLRSFIAAYLAVSRLERGELASAAPAVHRAKVMANDPARLYQSSFPIIYEGMIDQVSGRLDASVARFDAAIAMTEGKLDIKGNVVLLTALGVKAEALLDLGRLDAANAVLRRAQADFSSLPCWFEIYAPQLRVRYLLASLGGGVRAALAAIDSFGAELVPFRSTRMTSLMLAYRADARARARECGESDVDELQRQWQRLREVPNTATWRELDATGLALARAATALQQIDTAREVLDALELVAVQHQWRRTLVESHLLTALAYLAGGAERAALDAMRNSLAMAIEPNIRGPFLGETGPGAHLLALLAEDSATDATIGAFATQLLRAQKQVATLSRVPFLTPREHLVLSQLSRGHANKVIARNLGLSENTVKTHLRSIFKKTDVQSREQAIALARRHIGGA
jgi:LuxR family maltose regulon positive regulatory protein